MMMRSLVCRTPFRRVTEPPSPHMPSRAHTTVPHNSGWLSPSLPHAVAHVDAEAYLLDDLNKAAGQMPLREWAVAA